MTTSTPYHSYRLKGGQVISNVHPETEECALYGCAVHNPTDHHMKDWPQHFRDPRIERLTMGMHPGLMERTCEHGVGHPDPDHMAWYKRHHTSSESISEGMHGCDGCCWPPDPEDQKITIRELLERFKQDVSDLWERWGDFTEDHKTPYAKGGDPRFYINKHSLYVDGKPNPDYDTDLYGPWDEAAHVEDSIGQMWSDLKKLVAR